MKKALEELGLRLGFGDGLVGGDGGVGARMGGRRRVARKEGWQSGGWI